MPENFDIQSAAREILAAGRMVETEALTVENGLLDAGDSNALIEGDVTAGASAKGARSLLVQGSLLGEPERQCRIDVGGQTVVIGKAAHAQVAAHSIQVGSGAGDCRFQAQADIWIGGDLADSVLVVGEFAGKRQEIERLRRSILQTEQDKQYVERQLDIDEKRIYKQMSGISWALDLSVGHIVQRSGSRIGVDLQPFYKIIGDKTQEEIDRALVAFFTKGVVGVVSKRNRQHIVGNPNRQKVFAGIIKTLYDLFSLTRKRDRQSELQVEMRNSLNALLDSLGTQGGAVHIGGEVQPNVEIGFILPEVERPKGGEISIGVQTAKLSVRPGEDELHIQVVRRDSGGKETATNVETHEMKGVTIRMQEGEIVWEKSGAFTSTS